MGLVIELLPITSQNVPILGKVGSASGHHSISNAVWLSHSWVCTSSLHLLLPCISTSCIVDPRLAVRQLNRNDGDLSSLWMEVVVLKIVGSWSWGWCC